MAAAAAASEEIEKLNEKLNDLKQDNLTLASQVEMCAASPLSGLKLKLLSVQSRLRER